MTRHLFFFGIALTFVLLLLPVNTLAVERHQRGYRTAGTGWELGAGLGWAHNSFDEINDYYLDRVAIPIGIFNKNLDDGFTGYIELGYKVTSQVTVYLGYNYLKSDIERYDDFTIGDYYGNEVIARAKTTLRGSISAPYLKMKVNLMAKKPTLFVTFGGALCYGTAEIRTRFPEDFIIIPGEPYRYTASGNGLFGTVGVAVPLSRHIDFVSELGYRELRTDDLKDENERYWLVDAPNPTRMSLSTEGVYFHGGLSIGF
ncbi:MAG: outer membrane beta-barrel protein [bacterium]|jgi:hypothetical protein